MNFSKTLRVTGLAFACGTALMGLYLQNASTMDVPSSVDQDFSVVTQEAAAKPVAEALSDWEFTAKERKEKCKFK